ncbi:MAG: hypothetical protein FJX16_12630, partial [Alphaproteobacteria bacterium]|nr:hypothetical protein [Alphaproteobacteria bacterium]
MQTEMKRASTSTLRCCRLGLALLLARFARHGRACPGHPRVSPNGMDARDKRGHDASYAIIMTMSALLCSMFSLTPAHAYKAYVSNEKGNSITVIDTDKLEA